ncbi:hypothetical protein ACHQM5_013498 [Ranunculus cassubicifolius]
MSSSTVGAIASLHPDVILTHILTRLDGSTLASLSCASSQLYSLSSDDALWTNICLSTWPSARHPRMRHLISDFPDGPRSFFATSFPLLSTPHPSYLQSKSPSSQSAPPLELISAVDLYYKNQPIFTKVHETEAHSRKFHHSSFQIDVIDPKHVIPTEIHLGNERYQCLMEDLSLSWIVVIGKKSVNLSSFKPVSVRQYRFTNDIQVKFVTILRIDDKVDVKCEMSVIFGGEMELYEVSMHVENMDGVIINGGKTLGILQKTAENGERKKWRNSEEARYKYKEYLKKIEVRTAASGCKSDILPAAAFGVSVLVSFWVLVLWDSYLF